MAFYSPTSFITGDEQLQRVMTHMRKTAARRVMTAGAIKAAQKLAKLMKQEIPSRFKETRASIGSRRLKVKEASGGGAIAGGLVGAGSKSRGKFYRDRGVGMQLQWLVLGTGAYYTGSGEGGGTGSGSMKPQVKSLGDVALQNAGTLKALWKQGARKQLVIEVQKGKAF